MARRPKPWYRKARRSWFVTIAGVQHNLGPNKAEAHGQFYELMRQPQKRKVAPCSLPAIADAFLDWTHRNRAPATYQWYRERLQSFVQEHPDLSVEQIRPHHVETWSAADHRSINTRRNLMRAVKRCLRWAVLQGYIDHNPVATLEIPGATSKEAYISPSEFANLLSVASNTEFSDLLAVTYQTGCRPQESLRVEARHVDLQHSRWIFPSSEAKGKSMPRVVYLNDEALRITQCAALRWPVGPIFRNTAGKPWNKDSAGCAFDRLRVKIGARIIRETGEIISDEIIKKRIAGLALVRVTNGKQVKKSMAELKSEARRKLLQQRARQLTPSLSLYALRHSFATNALKRGIDALTVAILMGHKDPSTLARTYQHLSHNPEHLLEQARRAAG